MAEPPLIHERIQHDLDVIRRRLRRMSELVLNALDDAVAAVAGRDRRMAYSVVLLDNRIDQLERHIDRLCQEFLVRHMPVAAQLRFIIATVKVNAELERIGDYAEAIARRAVTLSNHPPGAEQERIFEMARLAFQMLRQAVQAFLDGNGDLARGVFALDRPVDAMNAEIFNSLAHPPTTAADLTVPFVQVGVLNRIERVADRACNIAEEAIFASRGEIARHEQRHDVRILFYGERNAVRSQMAEAVARQRAPVNFLFSSAGTQPATALAPAMVKFMAGKGADVARQRPKSLSDVGRLDDFNVVVTLSKAADEACPDVPYGTMELNWSISDPSLTTGTDAEVEAAYQKVYVDLNTQIGELIDSLLGAHAELEEDR